MSDRLSVEEINKKVFAESVCKNYDCCDTKLWITEVWSD